MQLQRLDDRIDIQRDWFQNYSFRLVTTVRELATLVDMCISRNLCSLDLESTGVDNRIYPDEYFDDGKTTRNGIRTVDRIVGVCISFDGQHGYYIPLSHEPEESGNLPWDLSWDELTRLVNNCRVIFHNKKFDAEFLYPVTGKEYWKNGEYEDTFLMAKVISPLKGNPAGLKPLTKLNFGVDMIELDELFTPEMVEQLKRDKRSTKNFAVLHPKEGLIYGCSDGIFTYKNYHVLRDKLSEGDLSIYMLEKSFCNVVREMERNRVHVDIERAVQLDTECRLELDRVGDLIRDVIESRTKRSGKWLTLNVGSPKQLSMALITDSEGMKLKPTPEMIGESGEELSDPDDDDDDDDGNEEQKQYSLKDEALKSMDRAYGPKFMVKREGKEKPDSVFDLILEWRHYQKMKGSYVEKLILAVDKNGDVRPSFNQMGTDTARLSCKADKIVNGYSGVNFQGIPRDSDEDKPELFKQIRTCIIPRPGWALVKFDYAGEELRVVTNLSGDPVWTDSFLNKDGDVHSITARTLFGKEEINKDERNRGKRCNFAFIYGGGSGAIQRNVGCSMEDAQRHMNNLRSDVPVLMSYVDHQKAYAKKYKYILTAFGRKIPIPTIESQIQSIRKKAERCAINYTIQSTSADVIKLAMCYIDKQLRARNWKDRCRYVLTVHDEIVFEIKPEYLMEIIPLIDEWMTIPGRLPKAHGRTWVVPLLTEPGIDTNWKARYNYFEMVNGLPVDLNSVDENGKYTGKIKKGYYFLDGRMYQEIPDWLKPSIRRLDNVKVMTENTTENVLPEVKTELKLPPQPDTEVKTPEILALPDVKIDELKLSNQSDETEHVPSEVSPEVSGEISIDFDDIKLDIEAFSDTPKVQERAEATPKTPEKPSKSTDTQNPNGKHDESEVLRWTFRAQRNEYNMRRLHAVCILTEGNTLLRILNPNGTILVSDEAGIKVDPARFRTIADLFGLG